MGVLGVITHGTEIMILLAPLHEFGSTAKVTGGVLGNASILFNGEGCNGGFKRWPVNEIVWVLPFVGPVVNDGWLHQEVIYSLLMELGLFVGTQVE